MENFLILGMLIAAPDVQEAGKKALRNLRTEGAFKPRLGRNSFFRSLSQVDEIPIKNIKTGEMDTVQFPRFAF